MNPSLRTPHSRRTRRAALLVAPILALGLAACGDDDTDDPPPVATDPITTDPGTTDPGTTDPGDDMSMGFDESTIVGEPVEDAQAVVEADDRQFRVAVLDGEDQALTADLVEGRVNVAVVDGVVTEVAFYG